MTGPERYPTRPIRNLATRAIRAVAAVCVLAGLVAMASPGALAQSRIKDIADFEGVRENPLVGYGLVVGLLGTGDSLGSAVFTRESLIGMLERLGVNARDDALDTDNVAAVMVTATLPAFGRQGGRIDVTVSAIGDATSLLGGTLLVTPLLGADGEVYAVAQGNVAVGGFSFEGDAESLDKGVSTSGRIANGAVIEREVGFELADLERLRIMLRNPDFTTARRIAASVNQLVGGQRPVAEPLDPGTVQVAVPRNRPGGVVGLITDIENLSVRPDQIARVVIDEQNGVIVMGENVRISTVAIAQGNLTIRITETPQVSQPEPFSNTGTTAIVPRTEVDADQDEDQRLTVVDSGVTLQELVRGLNELGIGPRDMITILQAIKAAGALQAEIEVL